MKKYLYLFTLVLVFISCSDKTDTSFEPETEQDIIQYIEDNNLNATRSNSGLYYVINNEGSGARPTSTSNVTVDYKGYFLDEVVFDESNSNGISFRLNEVIQGWTEGITYFREGGNGILLVPYNLGYGASGRGSIPGGSVLIFNIRLLSIN
jgi:FKBP-type peptidyl-prolyl cis-trans isomerase FkpA|tara:strand:- start:2581 stop:3033 length:453 start_codon:yes stop_codon:yes gene_type:complete